jgi:alpha-N-acetylglucosaminidase
VEKCGAQVVHAYTSGDLQALQTTGQQLLGLLTDLDQLLGSCCSFMLGTFLERAKAYACGDAASEQLYEWNARTQITLWGTSDSGVTTTAGYFNRST